MIILMKRKSAHGGRFGHYAKLALVELTPAAAARYLESGAEPAMISTRAHGVARIIDTIEPLNTGARYPLGSCAASRAHRQLEARAAELNKKG